MACHKGGSSPLTRGKLTRGDPEQAPDRLIPAHAGKTRLRISRTCLHRAHPRSRGENALFTHLSIRLNGSSPLTRGKQSRRLLATAIQRLIPAHAGKTCMYKWPVPYRGAHPRSRGENTDTEVEGIPTSGSSPLTRGKLARHGRRHRRTGLIPAHAGKTMPLIAETAAFAAHPRSRGENDRTAVLGGDRSGSSPLTRGKPRQSPRARRRNLAHPRSRGENLIGDGHAEAPCGSSPLTRGKRRRVPAPVRHCGLIPAHAGKTQAATSPSPATSAHPRSRGENMVSDGKVSLEDGSSPLTRGKHFPTCAFTAQIDQILETLELAVSSGSYSVWVACATDAPQDQVRSIGLVLPSSRGAS